MEIGANGKGLGLPEFCEKRVVVLVVGFKRGVDVVFGLMWAHAP